MSVISECGSGWTMVGGRCFMLVTNYDNLQNTNTSKTHSSVTYTDAVSTCQHLNGSVAEVDEELLKKLQMYIEIWRITPALGHIWVDTIESVSNGQCTIIRVTRATLIK